MHNKEYRIFKKVLLHIALLIVVLISIFPFALPSELCLMITLLIADFKITADRLGRNLCVFVAGSQLPSLALQRQTDMLTQIAGYR